MEAIRFERRARPALSADAVRPDITEWDQRTFRRIISADLSPEQRARIVTPPRVYARQEAVIGVHWHPEFIPLDLILQRFQATFPNCQRRLIIPTQHNVLMELDGYAGVEIDCFSRGFNRKVQLLAHFAAARLERADVLKAMLAHTFKYRSSQLFEFLDTLIDPAHEERFQTAAAKTAANEELVRFVRVQASKLKQLLEEHESLMPSDMIKNKLVRHYFDALRDHFDDRVINHAQILLHAVKEVVKANFTLSYFYQTSEIIEEVRGLGGGLVIPHPEQFWPILLADYDVDGIEVWNPQSQEYTEFLINVVTRQNKSRRRGQRGLLIFMGDDTHMGEKALDPARQDEEKASRELGVQPAWDDFAIRKSLIVANVDRASLIEEYQARLA